MKNKEQIEFRVGKKKLKLCELFINTMNCLYCETQANLLRNVPQVYLI